MDIIDVSPGDLWVPADSLNGRLGEMLGGDCHSDDEALGPIYHINDGWRARDALRRVLAAGERCVACEGTGRCPVSDRVCTACGGRPHTLGGPAIGTGYTRPPHDLGHFIDAEIAGRITPLVAAAAWWTNAIRVEAGLRPLISIEGPWEFCDNGRDEWRRKKLAGSCRINFGVWGSTCTCGCDEGPGWHGGKNNGLMSPCKDADDGKRRADNYALVGGHALLNDGSLLLPLPDRIARLRLED